MTSAPAPRDRILAALAFQETDIVPYHLMIDETVRPRLAGSLGEVEFEQRIINHLPFYNLEPGIRWTSADTYVDIFGSEWRTGAFPHLERAPLQEATLAGYRFPERFELNFVEGSLKDFFAQHNQHFVMCGIAYGFFDRGWALRGMENFLMDFIASPWFVEELFEILTEHYLDLIDRIGAYPFDGIRFGDDWGYQRGVLVGVDRWRRYVKPGLKKIFGCARDKGLVVMVHSDGDVTELIPDLIEMGVQILNPLQPEAMDVLDIKARYGRDLCLNGGISSQFTLPRGTEREVRREVEACLRFLGKGGGYVASPAKAILPDVPLANAAALIDTLVNQPCVSGENEGLIPADQAEALRRVFVEFHPSQPHPPAPFPGREGGEVRSAGPLYIDAL
jgi:uroporphyrinogen decarboxylase